MLPVPPFITRRPLLRRALDVQVFSREDGLFDGEAHRMAPKRHDAMRTIAAGSCDAHRIPHTGTRSEHGNADAPLVGLNLMQGARQSVQQGWGVTRGSTHLTERCQAQLTVVIPALAGSVSERHEDSADDPSPLQLDRRHPQRCNSLTVANFYPRWRLATPASTSTVS